MSTPQTILRSHANPAQPVDVRTGLDAAALTAPGTSVDLELMPAASDLLRKMIASGKSVPSKASTK